MKELHIKTFVRELVIEKLTAFDIRIFNLKNSSALSMTLTNEEANKLAEFILDNMEREKW